MVLRFTCASTGLGNILSGFGSSAGGGGGAAGVYGHILHTEIIAFYVS